MERIGRQVGNYRLLDILGRGGMGTVYSSEHVYIGKKVAVKVLHQRFARYQEAIERFLREARAASSINHPNIVDVTDFGPLDDGGVFFVMEYLEGTSLEDLIEKEGAIPLHRAINIANQMALGLAAAHDAGVIHRDLKPENIMLIQRPGRRELVRMDNTDGYVIEKEKKYDFVKLLDFGIAKVMAAEEHEQGTTMQGAVFGTPEYMSPEAARGEEVDHRADIYSLGVIFFDMLIGRPPFEAKAAAEVLAMQINDEPPDPHGANPNVEITDAAAALIKRALTKDRDKRYQTMDDLREDLQDCYGSVAYRRNARIYGLDPMGGAPRPRRLTDELSEWIRGEENQLSLDEARQIARVSVAGEDDPIAIELPRPEVARRAIDEAVDGDSAEAAEPLDDK